MIGEFPAQIPGNVEIFSNSWRHYYGVHGFAVIKATTL